MKKMTNQELIHKLSETWKKYWHDTGFANQIDFLLDYFCRREEKQFNYQVGNLAMQKLLKDECPKKLVILDEYELKIVCIHSDVDTYFLYLDDEDYKGDEETGAISWLMKSA